MAQTKTLRDLKRSDLFQTKGYVNEEWIDAASGKTFDVYDPATLDKLCSCPEMGKEEIDRAVEAAHEAFKTYKKTTARQRARWLRKWSDLCLEHADDLVSYGHLNGHANRRHTQRIVEMV